MKNLNALAPEKLHRLMLAGIALLFLGLFVKLTWELQEDSALDMFDRRILIFISRLRVSFLNGSAVDFTALGSPTVLSLFTAVGIILLCLKHDWRASAYLGIGSAGAGLATSIMKRLFTRARPSIVPRLVEVSGFSYPSGHSLAATSFYFLLMFLAWRHYSSFRSRATLFVCTIAIIGGICFSRLYLGVHYPSDVLSGIFFGAGWVFLLTAYFPPLHNSN